MSQIEEAKVTAKRRDQRRLDMFVNAYSGFGGYKDPMNRITFGSGTVLNKVELESLFRFDWVARRIIEAIPEDATRQWIDVKADDNAIVTDLMGRMETLEVQNKVEEALILARLYGGAVIIIGALDSQLPDTLLNEDKISAVRFLNVLDRWQLQIDKTYDDPMQPDFGRPEIYRLQPIISGTGTGAGTRAGTGSGAGLGSAAWSGLSVRQNQRIHESRLIRFDGAYLPEITKVQNSGWYDSVLIAINEELKRHGTSVQSGAILMQDFITKALKLPNLAELLSNPEGQTALLTRVQWAIANTSSLGITLLGEDEEFAKIQTPIAGLVDLLNLYIELISAAAGIPRARLFGQSLGVLAGATETTRAYYDMVKSYQNKHMRRQIEKLIRIFLKDKSSKTRGREPQEWSFDFCQLWQPTDKEKAEVRKLMADTDQIYINTGVVTPDEIASSRFSPDGYSMETTIDFGLRLEFEKQAQETQKAQLKAQAEAAAAAQTGAAGQAKGPAIAGTGRGTSGGTSGGGGQVNGHKGKDMWQGRRILLHHVGVGISSLLHWICVRTRILFHHVGVGMSMLLRSVDVGISSLLHWICVGISMLLHCVDVGISGLLHWICVRTRILLYRVAVAASRLLCCAGVRIGTFDERKG